MAASKTTKKKTTNSKTTNKKKTGSNGFQNEIILLVILAASVILLVSNFGLGGFVGSAISQFFFGVMGLMAYVFPIVLFIGAAFLLSNRANPLAYKKAAALIVFLLVMCGLLQLLTEGYVSSNTLMDYYKLCSDYRTGGGIIGGALCISTTSAFGTVGGYVIIILVLLVCLIIITQKSFFGFINKILDWIIAMVKGGQKRYEDGRPERELKKELKSQQRQKAAQERREERIRKLEEALEAEEKEESVPAAPKKKKSSAKRKESHFLEGTELLTSRNGESKEPEGDTLTIDTRDGEEESQMSFAIHREEAPAADAEESIGGYGEAGAAQEAETPPFEPEKAHRQPSRNPKSSKQEIESGIVNIQHEINQQGATVKKEYQFPPLKLLKRGSGKAQGDSDAHLKRTAQKLQEILYNFGVNATVTNVSCGPTVTRYELQPEMGVKVSKIVGLSDDIKLNLAAADIRIEAPIPGKAAVGIEVPNKENSPVMLRELIQSQEFQNAKSKLSFAAGKDIAGKPVVADIAKMPHLLIAGATGSGKSVCINTLIISILYKASPEEVKLIMIDPKVVELSVYNGIPHLFIPVVTDPKKAAGALNWAVSEMSTRYNTFAEYGVRNLEEYNKKIEGMRIPEGEERPEKMPQIVIIVDELADLMMVAPGEVEDAICRLAQLARAAGIHLVIATQRPSVNVITGLIKANMPSRIAFAVSSGVDSRTILDMNGAEKLLGKGDMLFYPQGYQKPARLQGAFVSDEEVSSIVEFLANKNPAAEYNTRIEEQVNTAAFSGGASGNEEYDVYFEEAGKFIIEKERASIGMLQRMFKIGFNRAARIMDQLCDAGVVGPEEGTKPRKVLMTMEEFSAYVEENR
ncbi:DNA translocase FtsK 4TM domain-containing protein [Ruminococcus sp. 5_1_39BFAA]|uniref:FtsK/SpoIIIE family DNA translocase n=1 Tax=Ruminococcus sp. 5_1_39BFAA TaxID=457412 RepID=UPI0035695827